VNANGWLQILNLALNVLLLGGLLVLVVYAGWKAFRWLRKWPV
jgi:uncharacterized membrane protein YqjE